MQELLAISELERVHFGRELHDGLGQQMAGIKVLAQLLAGTLRQQESPLAPQAEKVALGIGEALRQSRALSHGLAPLGIAEAGLLRALDHLAHQIEDTYPVECQFIPGENIPDITAPDTVLHLFRIAQEASANAVRHGHASRITFHLTQTPTHRTLAVTDNGTGFPAVSPSSANGLGLRTMNHRAQVIGGSLDITSTPGNGTIVSCRLPLDPPATPSLTP